MIRGSLIFHRDDHRYIYIRNYRSTSQNYYENYHELSMIHGFSAPSAAVTTMNLQETIQGAPILQNHLPEGVAVHLEKLKGPKFWVAKVNVTNLPTKSSDPIFHCWLFLCILFLIVKYRSPSILSGFTVFLVDLFSWSNQNACALRKSFLDISVPWNRFAWPCAQHQVRPSNTWCYRNKKVQYIY